MNCDPSNVDTDLIDLIDLPDQNKLMIKAVKFQIKRNIEGFPFGPGLNKQKR
jgi:hypothetical protein